MVNLQGQLNIPKSKGVEVPCDGSEKTIKHLPPETITSLCELIDILTPIYKRMREQGFDIVDGGITTITQHINDSYYEE